MLGHGAGIGYTGPGWAPLTISVCDMAAKSIDKLPLLSLAYMFNRGCRPNPLAIITAQKAQSIQRSVTEARTNL